MKMPKNCSGNINFICAVILMCFFVFSGLAFAGTSREEKGYTLSLEELSRKAGKNIEKVNKKLEERKKEELNKERELEARECFEKGNALYDEGKLEEAKKEWEKAFSITQDPEMRKYVKESRKKAREDERARKRQEEEERRRLAKEKREEEARIARERKEKERLKREKERQLKKEIQSLEREAKRLYSGKKYNEASAKFKEVLSLDPKNKTASRYLKLIPEKIRKTKEKAK